MDVVDVTGSARIYWQGALRSSLRPPQVLWRAHSDAINRALFASWLSAGQVEYLLKTDTFDEAVADGLYPFLVTRAKRVIGMDLSILTLLAARSRYADMHSTSADVQRLPFTDGSFDVVVSNSTLDHFAIHDEIIFSLKELARVLRSGGALLLTLDNPANPVVAVRQILPFRLLNRLGILPYYVGATFSPFRLRRILRQTGFEVTQLGAVMHCPRVLAVGLARLFDKYGAVRTQASFLKVLMSFERMSHWPTRFLTGYFVSVRAIRR